MEAEMMNVEQFAEIKGSELDLGWYGTECEDERLMWFGHVLTRILPTAAHVRALEEMCAVFWECSRVWLPVGQNRVKPESEWERIFVAFLEATPTVGRFSSDGEECTAYACPSFPANCDCVGKSQMQLIEEIE